MRTILRFFTREGAARQIPFGRVSIIVQLLAVGVFLVYVLANTGVRLPLVSSPYEIEVAFSDAAGLDEGNRPTAAIAGITLGRVTEVHREGDEAVATLQFDRDVEGKIFSDATAEVRPINAINQLIVNVDPGTPKAGVLDADRPVPAERTKTYVQLDRVFEVLDVDTRTYLKVVLDEVGRAFQGRGGDLRSALDQLGELTEPAAGVAQQLAERRRLLARLVDGVNVIFTELDQRDQTLAQVISAGSDTVAATGANDADLAALVREVPGVLYSGRRALQGGRELAEPLVPALQRLGPAVEPLPKTLRDVRGLVPEARDLLERVDSLSRDGREPVQLLAEVSRQLGPAAQLAERPVRRLVPLVELLDRKKNGITQTTELLSGAFSTDDENGVRARSVVLPEEPKPENLGLAPSAAKASGDRPYSPLELKLSRAFEGLCSEANLAACLLRLQTPGLPGVQDVLDGAALRKALSK